jgi:hypothetical protein
VINQKQQKQQQRPAYRAVWSLEVINQKQQKQQQRPPYRAVWSLEVIRISST